MRQIYINKQKRAGSMLKSYCETKYAFLPHIYTVTLKPLKNICKDIYQTVSGSRIGFDMLKLTEFTTTAYILCFKNIFQKEFYF